MPFDGTKFEVQNEVAQIYRAAAQYIRDYGHQKNRYGVLGGPACLIGAVVYAAGKTTINSSRDSHLLTPLQLRGFTWFWNDAPETTALDVINALELTAAELENAE